MTSYGNEGAKTKIYLGNLVPDVKDEDVRAAVIEHAIETEGELVKIQVKRSPDGNCRGYGFVEFSTEAVATSAIERLDGKLLGERVLTASWASTTPSWETNAKAGGGTTVYVCHLPREFSEEQFRGMFAEFGIITKCILTKNNDGSLRGFGFLDFTDTTACAAAIAKWNGQEYQGKALHVAMARGATEKQSTPDHPHAPHAPHHPTHVLYPGYGYSPGYAAPAALAPYGAVPYPGWPDPYAVAVGRPPTAAHAQAGGGGRAVDPTPFMEAAARTKIYIGNLPPHVTDNELRACVLTQAVSSATDLVDIDVKRKQDGGGAGWVCKGYAFATFVSEKAAAVAMERLHGQTIGPKIITASWAATKPSWTDAGHTKDATLYVAMLPRDTTELDLHKMFAEFGSINKVNLAKNDDGTLRGFGFVGFNDAAMLPMAIKKWNGQLYQGKILQVSMAKSQSAKQRDKTILAPAPQPPPYPNPYPYAGLMTPQPYPGVPAPAPPYEGSAPIHPLPAPYLLAPAADAPVAALAAGVPDQYSPHYTSIPLAAYGTTTAAPRYQPY